jgi:hypothetical protein
MRAIVAGMLAGVVLGLVVGVAIILLTPSPARHIVINPPITEWREPPWFPPNTMESPS